LDGSFNVITGNKVERVQFFYGKPSLSKMKYV